MILIIGLVTFVGSAPKTGAGVGMQELAQAQRLMHFSPEARVVERIIKALQLLGREAEAQQAIAHFRTVYPREFADWEREQH